MRNQVEEINSKGNNSTDTVTCQAQRDRAEEINRLLKLPVATLIEMFLLEKDLKNQAYSFMADMNMRQKEFFNPSKFEINEN